MPFPKQEGRPYTKANVESLNAGQMGCYGIYVASKEWVYIGKGDIRARLLAHVNGDNPLIASRGPTHYYSAVTSDYDAEEKRLILEYSPTCNQKVG
jgi:hypothetical protein